MFSFFILINLGVMVFGAFEIFQVAFFLFNAYYSIGFIFQSFDMSYCSSTGRGRSFVQFFLID
jgi:hypothetical protein